MKFFRSDFLIMMSCKNCNWVMLVKLFFKFFHHFSKISLNAFLKFAAIFMKTIKSPTYLKEHSEGLAILFEKFYFETMVKQIWQFFRTNFDSLRPRNYKISNSFYPYTRKKSFLNITKSNGNAPKPFQVIDYHDYSCRCSDFVGYLVITVANLCEKC